MATELFFRYVENAKWTTLGLVVSFWCCASMAIGQDWPQFRGPLGNGHASDQRLPTSWGGFFDEPVWSTTIPGQGYSSPIVIGERIWLTSSERVALNDTGVQERLSKYPYDQDDFQAHASVRLFALELNAVNGQILRRIDLFTIDNPTPIHASNSYASPTPVSDGERIYCHFGSLGTACVDVQDGRLLWTREFKVDEITGGGGSPVLAGNWICLACDGADEQFVVGLDRWTGKTVWKTNRPSIGASDGSRKRAFSTPIVFQFQGREQLVSVGANWLVSYNPSDGTEWWRAKIGTGHACVPMPVFAYGRVFACTGYPRPQLVAVDANGTGDVTESHIAWTNAKQIPEISSPLMVGHELYFVSSMGVLSCVDEKTGTHLWQHRLGGNFAASPTYANEHIYFVSKEGITTVLRPGPAYVEIARNELFGQTLASMAVYDGKFLIRTDPTLYCIGSSK
ncbi:MAG: PQQ-binding-like beta-propeller repeat protein [Pirellula sp.]